MDTLTEHDAATPFDTSVSFSAIVQDAYGDPAQVLTLSDCKSSSLSVGPEDVVIHVRKRPIHPGDLHMIRGLPKGGPPSPLTAGANQRCSSCGMRGRRVPGFEGVGTVAALGAAISERNEYTIGQRVAFFHGDGGAWASSTTVPASTVVAVPDDVPDEIAAQMLINTITARIVLRAGHNSLPPDFELPVYILQTAAGSAVGMLISRLAMDLGVRPIRLVRSRARAESLLRTLPGSPVIATEDSDWKLQVKAAFEDRPLQVTIDSIGGSFLNEIADLMEHGGAIVNFGWLGSGEPDLSGFAPRELSIRGAAISGWKASASEGLRTADVQAAIQLAQKCPELFPVAADYPFNSFQEAIRHVSQPKVGTVLLSS